MLIRLHKSKHCDDFGLLKNAITFFFYLLSLYLWLSHEIDLILCKNLYIEFSNGTEQLKIILGFCEYCDRLAFRDIHIYVKSLIIFSDFLAFKNLIIQSPWMCTIDSHEKLLLHKEISKLKTDSVWLNVCQVLPS